MPILPSNNVYDQLPMQLRDLWASRMSDSGGSSSANVEAFDGLTRATLDIIGLAGFGYDFSSLNENKKSELYEAFSVVIKSGSTSAWRILQAQFAPLRILVCLFSFVFEKESLE